MVDAASHVLLIDGSGYIFRAFHGLPPLTRADGTPINAVFGFCTMVQKLSQDEDADHIVVLFDTARQTFRNAIYPDYKAHRPPVPEELIPQFPLIRDATRAYNLAQMEMEGFEADDLIATYTRLAREQGARVTIASSDKDLMQLVGDGVTMLDPMKGRRMGVPEVEAKFGVPPDQVVDVQALAGDSSDNVPGVPGIGIKTAAQLILQYGDLDRLLAQAGEIRQPKRRQALLDHADKARISRDLVRLRQDVPVGEPLSAFRRQSPEPAVLRAFLVEQDFKRLIARLDSEQAPVGTRAQAGGMAGTGATGDAAAGGTTARPAIDTAGYELVQTEEALDRWIEQARAAGTVAVDTETTGLDAMRAALVGVSLAVAPGVACYIPLQHVDDSAQGSLELETAAPAVDETRGPDPDQIPLATALDRLRPLLVDPSVLKVGQNLKYDAVILGRYGLSLAPVDDTMLMSYVVDGTRHGHGMDELAALHLNHKTIAFSDVAGSGKKQVTFDKVPLDKARDYAAEDADVTLRLHAILRRKLREARMISVYETLERPLVTVIADMETAGVRVDPTILRTLGQTFAQRMTTLEEEIHALAGEAFNVGSPKQLGEILFDRMGLKGGKRGKNGAWSTSVTVLETLAAEGHDLPRRVLDWRHIAKLKNTYADALLNRIHPKTGRVHTSFSLAATATGRLSSTEPNLQNIPVRSDEGRRIRQAFVAEPGHRLLAVDYSQIELRLLAEIGDIAALKQAFRDGLDIHAMTASEVFGVPMEGMDPMVRRRAKAINFGIVYGISAFGLARQIDCSRKEAKALIDAYFARFPGIRAYMDRTIAEAKDKGYVTTLFGRRCPIAGIREKTPARRSAAERQAINAPIQGAAADVIKRAMVRIPGALAQAGLSGRMLLQVHDELLFEVPEAETEATAACVRNIMETAAIPARALDVPLIADAGSGPDWASAH